MNGNKERIIGTEWDMGFGQVASCVALITVVYAIILSYQDYLIKLEERKQRGTSTSGENKKDMEMAFVAL